jgi:hypothetical protein
VFIVLLPTLAAVSGVVTLAVLGRRLELEMIDLRRSLRLMAAASVAADELSRTTAGVRQRAISTREQARRLRRARTVGARHPR